VRHSQREQVIIKHPALSRIFQQHRLLIPIPLSPRRLLYQLPLTFANFLDLLPYLQLACLSKLAKMADVEHTYKFNVSMSCGGCSGAVDRVLKKLDGMSSIY
jgi:hypothetical protein